MTSSLDFNKWKGGKYWRTSGIKNCRKWWTFLLIIYQGKYSISKSQHVEHDQSKGMRWIPVSSSGIDNNLRKREPRFCDSMISRCRKETGHSLIQNPFIIPFHCTIVEQNGSSVQLFCKWVFMSRPMGKFPWCLPLFWLLTRCSWKRNVCNHMLSKSQAIFSSPTSPFCTSTTLL